jgi:hypothetical protein
MKRVFSAKSIAAAAVLLGAFGAATAAHARSDVALSVGVQVPGAYVQAPVYSQVEPAYWQPRYGQSWERARRGPYGDRDRDGIANFYDSDNDYGRHNQHAQLRGPWGDFDRDGVPNRFDRFPANPNRR